MVSANVESGKNNETLRPCPFCGETEISFSIKLTNLEPIKGKPFYMATCTNCLAQSEIECCEENAIMSWNHRPLEDALQRKLDIAEIALKRIANTNDNPKWMIAERALKQLKGE